MSPLPIGPPTTWLLVAAWVWPLALAPLAVRRWGWWTTAVGALPALAAALLVEPGSRVEIPWLLLGTAFGIVDDPGRLFLAFAAVLWLAAGVYAARAFAEDPQGGRFRLFFLLALAGNLWLIGGRDIPSFYLGFSAMGLAAYGLVIHYGDPAALRAGRIYLVMTVAGEMMLFMALVLVAHHAGSLTPTPADMVGLSNTAVALLILGLAVKAGLVPLHIWLPLAHPAAPVPASAVLSAVMIKVSLIGWLRFLPIGQAAMPDWGMLLVFAGLGTLFFAVPVGLVQSDPKVVLAYSSVSKMGLMVLALGLMLAEPVLAPAGVLALALYATHHALAKGGLFLGVGLRKHAGASAAGRLLVLAGLTVLALSLAGAPGSGGAVAKYALKPVLAGGDAVWIAALVGVGTVATALLMARFLWIVWHTEPHPTRGFEWGLGSFGLLAGLTVLYVPVLVTLVVPPEALKTNLLPLGLAALAVLPVVWVAWRQPRLLKPVVGQVRPGDLAWLVRPLAVAGAFGLRAFGREWPRFVRRLTAPLAERAARVTPPEVRDRPAAGPGAALGECEAAESRVADPDRALRDWRTAGVLWLASVAGLLAAVLAAPVPVPGGVEGPPAAAPPAAGPEGPAAPAPGPQPPPRPQPQPAPDTQPRPQAEPLPEPETAAEIAVEQPPAPTPSPASEPVPDPIPEPIPGSTPSGTGSGEPAGVATEAPEEIEPQPTAEAPPEGEPEPEPEPEPTAEVPAPPRAEPPCDPATPFLLDLPGAGEPLALERCVVRDGRPVLRDAPEPTRELVRRVQRRLAELGYAPGPVDGLIGPLTRDALGRARADLGLPPTAALDFALLEGLAEAPPGGPPAGKRP